MTSDTSYFSGYVQAHEIQRFGDDYDMMKRMKSLEGVRVSMRMNVKAVWYHTNVKRCAAVEYDSSSRAGGLTVTGSRANSNLVSA